MPQFIFFKLFIIFHCSFQCLDESNGRPDPPPLKVDVSASRYPRYSLTKILHRGNIVYSVLLALLSAIWRKQQNLSVVGGLGLCDVVQHKGAGSFPARIPYSRHTTANTKRRFRNYRSLTDKKFPNCQLR